MKVYIFKNILLHVRMWMCIFTLSLSDKRGSFIFFFFNPLSRKWLPSCCKVGGQGKWQIFEKRKLNIAQCTCNFMSHNKDQFRPKILPFRRKVHHVLNREKKLYNQEIEFLLHCIVVTIRSPGYFPISFHVKAMWQVTQRNHRKSSWAQGIDCDGKYSGGTHAT